MKTSEHFALDEWLSDYPDDLTYAEVIAILKDPKHTWRVDDISVWETVETCTLSQVADFIDSTKSHFERVTA
jgi:hypothetical protein